MFDCQGHAGWTETAEDPIENSDAEASASDDSEAEAEAAVSVPLVPIDDDGLGDTRPITREQRPSMFQVHGVLCTRLRSNIVLPNDTA